MNKSEKYTTSLTEIKALLSGETDLISKMANTAALLHKEFDFWWTGFYRVVDNELILGPFQGPPACMHIAKGKGVCGTAWEREETIVVPNVHLFEGHIACSSQSNSEIVVPILRGGEVVGVLDIDSREFNTFDDIDKYYLQQIVELL